MSPVWHPGRFDNRPGAPEGSHEFDRVVGPNHAAAAGEQERLDHTRIGDFRGNGFRVDRRGHALVAGYGHATSGKAFAHHELVASGKGGVGIVVGEPQRGAGLGGDHCAPVVNGEDGGDRVVGTGKPNKPLNSRARFPEVEGEVDVPSFGEFIGKVDGADEFEPNRAARLGEGPGAIGGRAHEGDHDRLVVHGLIRHWVSPSGRLAVPGEVFALSGLD